MSDDPDPYRVLGVPSTASLLEIARARRRLAKRHHPDLVAGDAAGGEMARINAAWELLANPRARAAWDAAAASVSTPRTPVAASWAPWTDSRAARPPPSAAGSGNNAGWWVLALTTLFLLAIVVGGIISTLDCPADLEIAPWLQENLDH
jgi:curved DNA-binding protein CbpA